jgi:23S rRNA (cytidine2498-2'-O)-methyltransferase
MNISAPITGYLAADGFLPQLRHELSAESAEACGNLLLLPGPPREAAWVANIWHDVRRAPIASIGDAAKQLRAIQRNWAFYPCDHHRRAALITEQLPKVSAKPLAFGTKINFPPLGSWTLTGRDEMLYAANCSSPFPNGEMQFVENKEMPPSRAYLKLWEALTVLGEYPKPGELCLDLGACPGGWSWVMQQCGARVISVDKAPLEPRIAQLPNIEYRQESAFGLDPRGVGQVDWLFSDIICYPARLLALVKKWLEAGNVKNFVCTIKFQGETDFETVKAFSEISGARVMHLHHNKHELTWAKLA